MSRFVLADYNLPLEERAKGRELLTAIQRGQCLSEPLTPTLIRTIAGIELDSRRIKPIAYEQVMADAFFATNSVMPEHFCAAIFAEAQRNQEACQKGALKRQALKAARKMGL